MAYDGIITYGISLELTEKLIPGKIEKVYQPGPEELILQVHTRDGKHRLFLSCNSQSARVCLTEERYRNPEEPPTFCMLLRKHIQSGHITSIHQNGSERIIEIDIETISELGMTISKRLMIEIMGKHSNIILIDIESGKIIDSIKHISIDVNRYRQLLPGVIYQYPPAQEKLPFKEVSSDEDILKGEQIGQMERTNLLADPKYLMSKIAGISPALAREIASHPSPAERLMEILAQAEGGVRSNEPDLNEHIRARAYLDDSGTPIEFHLAELSEYEGCEVKGFDSISSCVEFYYQHREQTNTIRMKSQPLLKSVKSHLEKSQLKKKKIGEDILRAEDSDKYKLYGELITANIHVIKPGAKSVTLTNYYTGEPIDVPLDEKLSASKNAQHYFKQYAKARTALKEKASQLEETENDIAYLESVIQAVESAASEEDLDSIREEMIVSGYIRARKADKLSMSGRGIRGGQKGKKQKPEPIRYTISDGSTVYVGRNNTENDYVSMKLAERMDLWFHTKDIPGSHVVLKMERRKIEDLGEDVIYEVASIAAYHSKAKDSENVPVDFTYIKYVKKPAGAKPGMVIFTNNTTVYVNPSAELEAVTF